MFFVYCFLSQKRAEGLELFPRIEIFCLEDDVIIRRLDLALVLLFVVLHVLDIGGEERAVFDCPLFDLGVGYTWAVDGDLSSCGFRMLRQVKKSRSTPPTIRIVEKTAGERIRR